jgi:hypothetical protein
MKNTIVILFLMLGINLFAQENEQFKMFSTFHFGVLGGTNFSTLSGGSLIIEGKTNLTSDLNLTLSLGYSTINKKEGYVVQTYQHIVFTNYDQYATQTYTVNDINYDVFPISLGFQYIILHDVFSPYALLEGGYNFFSFHQTQSSIAIAGASYDTYGQLPAAYKGAIPLISEDNSYRIAVGVGTTYKLSRIFNLDVRYLYQYNKSIENTHQILIGFNF